MLPQIISLTFFPSLSPVLCLWPFESLCHCSTTEDSFCGMRKKYKLKERGFTDLGTCESQGFGGLCCSSSNSPRIQALFFCPLYSSPRGSHSQVPRGGKNSCQQILSLQPPRFESNKKDCVPLSVYQQKRPCLSLVAWSTCPL